LDGDVVARRWWYRPCWRAGLDRSRFTGHATVVMVFEVLGVEGVVRVGNP
jgi:hypothetical protein